MKLVPTRRTDYGIRAMIHLANADGALVKADDIGSAMDIPTGFLQQVLQELHRSRLVISRPGPNGGHALARDAESITILEIVEVLEGPFDAVDCALRGGPCHWDEVCALHWVWSSARSALSRSSKPPRWPGWRPTTVRWPRAGLSCRPTRTAGHVASR